MVRPVRPARRRTSPGHPSREGAARTGRPRRRASSQHGRRRNPGRAAERAVSSSPPCQRSRRSAAPARRSARRRRPGARRRDRAMRRRGRAPFGPGLPAQGTISPGATRAMGVTQERPSRRETGGFVGDSPQFVKLGCCPQRSLSTSLHPAAGGGARRQPPRWRSRTASSDNSAFRTCSPPSRRSLRSPPLLGASAWTPAPRALRNRQLSDDAALHFPLRRGRCSGRCSERWTPPITPRRCVIRPNDSNHNPSHTIARGADASERRPRWTDRGPRKSRETINAPRVMPGATPRKPDDLLAQLVFLRHTCRAGSLRASCIPAGRTATPPHRLTWWRPGHAGGRSRHRRAASRRPR